LAGARLARDRSADENCRGHLDGTAVTALRKPAAAAPC
jgi:hypothetical protein